VLDENVPTAASLGQKEKAGKAQNDSTELSLPSAKPVPLRRALRLSW
jgi:hypothetical protein